MGWKGIGNPQPGHLRDQNAPGLAIGKVRFSAKRTRNAPIKRKPGTVADAKRDVK